MSKFSVRRPYTIIVGIIAVIVLGVISVMNMTTDLLPSINLPYAVVITTYPGASPEEIEATISVPIEKTLSATSGLEGIRSVSRENVSIVIMSFTDDSSMDSIVLEMRESLDVMKAYLPSSAGSPMILKLNPDMLPIMIMAVDIEGEDIEGVSDFIQNQFLSSIEAVPGVASADALGLLRSWYVVELDLDKIDAFKKTVAEKISSEIAAQKAILEGAEAQINGGLTEARDRLAQLQLSTDPQFVAVKEQLTAAIAELEGRLAEVEAGLAKLEEAASQENNPLDTLLNEETISGILKASNLSFPAGYVEEAGSKVLVRVGDALKGKDELENLMLVDSEKLGVTIRLSDIASVIVSDNSSDSYSKVNGENSVMLTLQKQTEYSTSDVTHAVMEKVESMKEQYPGLRMTPFIDQGKYIDIVVGSVTNNLLIGAILAIFVLIIFLWDWRPTLMVALSIPLSLVSAIVLMYFFGVTLNVISLGGLALGVGMLVDNSIVVIENIYRLRSLGMNAREAAVKGAKQISGAITSSTITTVVVFLPIVFTTGITRQLFVDMGLTIAFSLLASLVIALTFIPMAAAGMLRSSREKQGKVFTKVKSAYGKALSAVLSHKAITIIITLVLFFGSAFGLSTRDREFFPASKTSNVSISLALPADNTFDENVTIVDAIMSDIYAMPEIESAGISMTRPGANSGGSTSLFSGGLRMLSSRNNISVYTIIDKNATRNVDYLCRELEAICARHGIQCTASSSMSNMSLLTGSGVAIQFSSYDLDILKDLAMRGAELLSTVDGIDEVDNGFDNPANELRVTVDKDKAAARGTTVAQVLKALSDELKSVSAVTSVSTTAGSSIDVYVESENTKTMTKEEVGAFVLTGMTGETFLLSDIASVNDDVGFSSITRRNQVRVMTISGTLKDGYNIAKVSDAAAAKFKDFHIPDGSAMTMTGENETINDAMGQLVQMGLLALILVYLVMVAEFQSLKYPLIIMSTMLLAATGGYAGMLIAGITLSVVSLIGFALLVGIVVNNGIVLIDYTNQLRVEGRSMREAVVEAGQTRLRPIIMTSLTTIIAMLTLALGIGSGTETMQPMAVTVIGGLTYSTIMTLFIVPVFYEIFSGKNDRRFIREREERELDALEASNASEAKGADYV